MMMTARFVCVCLALFGSVDGWDTGDFVPLLARSQFNGNEVTTPRELGTDLSPRFGRNKVVHLQELSQEAIGKGDFKVAFELGHGLGRKTPWIVVQSGCEDGHECVRLQRLTFTFKYEMGSYGKIVDFQVLPRYTKTGKHHEHIIMDFVWFEDHDHDIHTALFALYSLSVVVSVVLFTLMFVPSEIVRKGQMLVKDLRSQ